MAALSTDVLVIGGGATGAGVAWDAALRGFDVVLVDRADLAEGTSGRFHGLLHSGGRYVVKDPRAAEECIAENWILCEVAADCIEHTGEETDVEARVTVNAAGAWAGRIADMAGIEGVRVLPGRGIMIAMNHR